MPPSTAVERLRQLYAEKKKREGHTLRNAAKECGISPATLMRFERGDSAPSKDTLIIVAEWVGGGEVLSEIQHQYVVDGGNVINAHLRAGKDLPPDLATTLAKMFKLVIEQRD